eukprot:COSAG05_NODE_160_length_15590_cov_14.460848_4_plen_52_part_00
MMTTAETACPVVTLAAASSGSGGSSSSSSSISIGSDSPKRHGGEVVVRAYV